MYTENRMGTGIIPIAQIERIEFVKNLKATRMPWLKLKNTLVWYKKESPRAKRKKR